MSGKCYLNFRMLWSLLNEHHLLEWGLTIIGATVFIAGFINAAIAFRSSTITWAVFSCIIGTAGLVTFFAAGLELFFKVASTLILSYQKTLALEMANVSKNMIDVGTMTVSLEENKNMLITFPAIDHGFTSNQQERIKCINIDPLQSKNQTKKLQENIAAECSISVHAAEKSSPETLYYEYDNGKEKLALEDITDKQLTNTDNDKLSTDIYLKNSNVHPECQKISPDKKPSLSLENLSANKQLKTNLGLGENSISKNPKEEKIQSSRTSKPLFNQGATSENFEGQKASKQTKVKMSEEMQSKYSVLLCLQEIENHLNKALERVNNSESKSLQMDMLTPVNSTEMKSFKSKPLPALPDIFNTAFTEYSGVYKTYHKKSLLGLRTPQQMSKCEDAEVYY